MIRPFKEECPMTDFDERFRADLALVGQGRSDADLATLLHTPLSKLRSFTADPQSAPAGFFDTLAEICLLRHNAIAFAEGPQSFIPTAESAHFLESSKLYAEEAARLIAVAWTVMRNSLPAQMPKRALYRRLNAWLATNPCQWRNPARSLDELADLCGKPVDQVLRDLGFTIDGRTS
jgi:AraC-like DNA-binding protein